MKQPLNRYSREAYDVLNNRQERDCYNGFGYVWMDGGVGNENMFITEFKNRLRDCCCQGWFSHMAKSERFDLYSCFRNTEQRERNLQVVQSRVYQTALARFPMDVSRINGHRLRILVAEDQRFCSFCVDETEDERHVLVLCPVYSQLREKFPGLCTEACQ